MLSRRGILAGAGALAVTTMGVTACSEKVQRVVGFIGRIMEIIKRHGGTVGLSAIIGDSASNSGFNIESDTRFAMCSTFKWVLAAAVLQAADQGKLKLDQAVKYGKADLLDNAPVTTDNVAKGRMSVADLCAAAVEKSDNTAANLLLGLIGGPAGLTTFARSLGDQTTRFDRTEPTLNTNVAGDEKDTTTPAAMAALLRTVYMTPVLKAESLDKLKGWMVGCTTGANRIRAGVPTGYIVGDKTGTGANGAVNDVAVIWPTADAKVKGPIFLAVYTSGGTLDAAGRDKVIADITRVVFDTIEFAEELDEESASSVSESPAASMS